MLQQFHLVLSLQGSKSILVWLQAFYGHLPEATVLTIATKYPSALGIIYHLVNLHACASLWDGHLITVTVSVSPLLLLRDTRLLICQINHTMEMKAESQHRAVENTSKQMSPCFPDDNSDRITQHGSPFLTSTATHVCYEYFTQLFYTFNWRSWFKRADSKEVYLKIKDVR